MLGPLYPQELFRLGRRGAFFALRAGVPVGLLAALWAAYPHTAGRLPIAEQARVAGDLFVAVVAVQMAAVWFLAPLFAAAVLTEERERKTLDLLLTTTLTGRELVLGKLAARLTFVGGVLLAGLPVFGVLQLFGGVPIGAVVLAYAGLFANLWSVGGVTAGIAATAGSYRTALFAAWAVLALLGGLCPLFGPFFAVAALAHGEPDPTAAVLYFASHLAAGLVGALAAVNVVRPWEGGPTEQVRIKRNLGDEDEPAAVVPRRPPAVTPEPRPEANRPAGVPVDFSWDDPPGECDGPPADVLTAGLAAAAAGLGLLVGFAAREPRYDPPDWPPVMAMGWTPAAVLTAATAAAAVAREREGDTLTMLLTVPPGRGEILWRKAWAAGRRSLWAWAVTLAAAALFILPAGRGAYWFLGFAAEGAAAFAAAVAAGTYLTVACRTTFLAQSAAVLAMLAAGMLPWWLTLACEGRERVWLVPAYYAGLLASAAVGWWLARRGFDR
jgi:ABC-type transport system involved in multi-copper enzyme maturation permease subunit